jgi:hypothetical protein
MRTHLWRVFVLFSPAEAVAAQRNFILFFVFSFSKLGSYFPNNHRHPNNRICDDYCTDYNALIFITVDIKIFDFRYTQAISLSVDIYFNYIIYSIIVPFGYVWV